MSAQPLPPLPPNWTEHIGPGGVKYYYNAITQESTYIRPLPVFPIPPAPQAAPQKDKPLTKTPIPGTDWIRVKTVQGKTFYTNRAKKASVWTVPDEIKDDYQVIAQNFAKIAEALKGVDLTSGQTPSPEALAKLQELSKTMNSAEVQQASQHIEAWVKEHC